MIKRGPTRPRAPLLLFCAAFLAVLMAATATDIWHTHSSAAEAATCRVCHVGSTPAPRTPITVLAAPAPTVVGVVALPVLSAQFAPVFNTKSPRAPPHAA
jgi:hypothetical protein